MEQTVNSKVCTQCNIEKGFDEFYKDKYGKSGLRSYCKECRKQHYQTNKGRISEQKKQYRQANKEQILERAKQYRQANKEQILEKQKQYDQKPEVKARRNERYKTDPKFRLNNTMSRGIRHSLKNRNSSKGGSSWLNYVDYTLEQLVEHLEKQFDNKMTWENQGSYWHIDHIIPVSRFNFTSPYDEEFKKCWALSNLQPLEAIENIRKQDKTMEEWLEYKHKSSHLTPATI